MTSLSLTKRTTFAAKWSLFSSFGMAFIRFSTTAILAHYLSPSVFGLFGMSMLVIEIVTLFGNLGLNNALLKIKEPDALDINTVYWANNGAASMAFVAAFLLSFPAALFFKDPEVRSVIQLTACTLVIPAMAGMSEILLRKELRYARLSCCGIAAAIVQSTLLLICAIQFKMGVFSFVAGTIAWFAVSSICKRCLRPWSPQLSFSLKRFKPLFRFGRNFLGANVCIYLTRNLDYIIIGRVLGPYFLGLYQLAYRLPHLIHTSIARPVTGVLTMAMCEAQESNKRLKDGLIRACRLIALTTFPIAIGLFLVAEDFVLNVYGQQWAGAVNPLRILCATALIRLLSSVISTPIIAKGRPDLSFKWDLTKLIIAFPALLIASYFGITAVAWAMFITTCVDILFYRIILRLIDMRFGELFQTLVPAVVSCLLMSGVVIVSKELLEYIGQIPHWPKLIIFVIIGILSYALSVRLLFPNLLKEGLDFVLRDHKKVAEPATHLP